MLIIIITAMFYKDEKKKWIGECIELGTTSFGDTIEEAEESLKDLIILHLDTLEEIGERERFFKEHNIRTYRRKPESIRNIRIPYVENTLVGQFQVPVPV